MRWYKARISRWAAAALAVILLVGCIQISLSSARAASVDLRVPGSASFEVGDQVTVELVATVSQAVTDGVLTLQYDRNALDYVSAQQGSAWTNSGRLVLEDNGTQDGRVVLAFAAENQAATNGILFTVTFAIQRTGSVTISLGSGSYLTGVSGDLSASVEINVGGGTQVTPGPTPTQSPADPSNPGTSNPPVTPTQPGTTNPPVTPTQPGTTNPPVTPTQPGTTNPPVTPTQPGTTNPPEEPGASDPPVTPTLPGGGTLLPPVTPSQPPEEPEDPEVPAVEFTDVETGAWYYGSVAYMVEKGLMLGVSDTVFAPDDGTTRGMLATILYRLAGSPEVSGSMDFTDIQGDAYYRSAVLWAVQNGITMGVSDTAFAPDDQITREQLVTLLYRYAQATGRDTTARANLDDFGDVDRISGFARDAMAWAVAEGIVQGGSNAMILPGDEASRAQIAAIIQRFDTAE